MLKQWLQQEGLTLTALAKQVGKSKGYLCTLAKDPDLTPSLELAFDIETATKGGVPARYWYDRGQRSAA